jgi:hypothetical protein
VGLKLFLLLLYGGGGGGQILSVLSTLIVWLATPCEIAVIYQHFGETYCLHVQGGAETQITAYKPTRPYNPKACIGIFTDVRTSDLTNGILGNVSQRD